MPATVNTTTVTTRARTSTMSGSATPTYSAGPSSPNSAIDTREAAFVWLENTTRRSPSRHCRRSAPSRSAPSARGRRCARCATRCARRSRRRRPCPVRRPRCRPWPAGSISAPPPAMTTSATKSTGCRQRSSGVRREGERHQQAGGRHDREPRGRVPVVGGQDGAGQSSIRPRRPAAPRPAGRAPR